MLNVYDKWLGPRFNVREKGSYHPAWRKCLLQSFIGSVREDVVIPGISTLVFTQFHQWTGTQRHQLVYAIDPSRSRNITNYGDSARKRGASCHRP